MEPAKWYLGMRIKQHQDYVTIDQSQYVKNITSIFEKAIKYSFKLKDSPLPTSFIPRMKEVKLRFRNLNYRSVIGSILQVSCWIRLNISFAVNKLDKFSNNPGVVHFRYLLHLIRYKKNTPFKGLKFYSKYEQLQIF